MLVTGIALNGMLMEALPRAVYLRALIGLTGYFIGGSINLESVQATASSTRSNKPRVLPSTAPEPGEST